MANESFEILTAKEFNENFLKTLNFKDHAIANFRKIYNLTIEKVLLETSRKFFFKNTDEPLISIYTPTYNRAKILTERAVNSVLNQTYKRFEYIIIGDCCSDETEKLINKINDKRIKFFNLKSRKKRYPENGIYAINHWYCGSAFAANEGLRKTSGEWIARIDDWATWKPDHIEDNINFIKKNPEIEFISGPTLSQGKKYEGSFAGEYLKLKKQNNEKFGSISTWFFKNYLKLYKFSLHSWRNKWNRVCDTDVMYRMFTNNVRVGWRNKITHEAEPRPGSTKINFLNFLEKFNQNKNTFKF